MIRGHFGPSDVDPVALLGEDWFVDQVLLCPAVIGSVRSLLGRVSTPSAICRCLWFKGLF